MSTTAAPSRDATSTPPLDSNSASINVSLAKVVASKTNPGRSYTPERDKDLVESIKVHGVIEPIVVRSIKATIEHVTAVQPHAPFALGERIYEIVAGERRYHASMKAGRASIPAVIRELNDAEALELQTIENDQREDLDVAAKAAAYRRVFAEYRKSGLDTKAAKEKLCQRLNREIRTVEQFLSLEKLAWQCDAALSSGELEASHAYELCRRPEDEQLKLLAWMRTQTQHSHGDVPSVRRLKDEIRRMDVANEDKRRQNNLFADPRPGTSTTKAPTVAPKPQGQINATAPMSSPIATKSSPRNILSPAEVKKETEAAARRDEQHAKALREHERLQRVDKKFRGMFFSALAKKSQINSRLLTHVIPNMIFEVWENELTIEEFAQQALQWPAPKQGTSYSYQEVREHSAKHTRKFTPGLLAAMVLTLYMNEQEVWKVARYMGVDPKKLRKQAAGAVKEEERKFAQTSARKKAAKRG